MTIEDVDDLVTSWEEKNMTEEEIVDGCLKLLYREDATMELFYNINDVLNWKGYSYQFRVPDAPHKEFDSEEYGEIVSQCSKSKQKTLELIKYLHDCNEWRLTLNSLHFIKMSMLFELGILPKFPDEALMKYMCQYNLYDFYMSLFEAKHEENPIKIALEKWFETIGLSFCRMDYMQFRLANEYLLWTITKNDKTSSSYLKVNSIKVALSICPREYLCFNGKEYYNKNMHKNLVKYLALIDKNEIKRIKDKYGYLEEVDYDTGYKLLFNLI